MLILVQKFSNQVPLNLKSFQNYFFFSYTHKLEVQNYVVFSTIVN